MVMTLNDAKACSVINDAVALRYLCPFRLRRISGPLASSLLSVADVKVENRLKYIDCFNRSASRGSLETTAND